MFAAPVVISVAVVLFRHAYELGANPRSAIPVRLGLPALALWLWVAADVLRGRPSPFTHGRRLTWSAVVAVTILSGATGELMSLDRIEAPLVVLFFALVPIWIAILARILFGIRIGFRTLAAIGLVIVGTIAIVGGPTARPDTLGVALAVGGSVSAALTLLVLERPLRAVPPQHVWCIGLTLGACIAYGVNRDAVEQMVANGSRGLVFVLIGSALAGVSLMLISWGIQQSSAMIGSFSATTEVIYTAVFASIFLGETLSALALAGAAFILAGVLVAHPAVTLDLRSRWKRRPVERDALRNEGRASGSLSSDQRAVSSCSESDQ